MPVKDPVLRKLKQREYSKKHYRANKAKYLVRISNSKRLAKQQFQEFKARLACVKCGENHPATLDFHHVVRDPSNRRVSLLIRNGSYAAAIEEIMHKCIVLCSNCHRKHHDEERKNTLPKQGEETKDT